MQLRTRSIKRKARTPLKSVLDDAKRRSQPRSTTLSPFELLPNELWRQILRHLANLDKKHLAEVSSRSREAVNLPPFDTLALRASDPTTLKEDVTSCISMLKASKRFLRFRCLEIGVQVSAWQHLPNDDEVSFLDWLRDVRNDLPGPDSSAARRAAILRSRDTEEVEHQSKLLNFQRVMRGGSYSSYKRYDAKKLERNFRSPVSHDDRWECLIELVRRMPDLEDLFFHLDESFPKCLLATLHEHGSRCRLHLTSFEFRKLVRNPDGESLMIHQDELAIATSPCLYSIRCNIRDITQNTDRAILSMASGMASNLKEVTHSGWKSRDPLPRWTTHTRGGRGRLLQTAASFPYRNNVRVKGRPPSFSQMICQPWTGPLSMHDETSQRRGSLTKLVLDYGEFGRQVGRQDMEIWASKTDLSALKILHLHTDVFPSGLAWIEETKPFTSLENVWVTSLVQRELLWPWAPSREDASRFLQSLPPLKIIWINFERTPSFDDIAILAAVSSLLDELCFPHGANTAEKGRWGLPDETNLLVQALRSHGIKPKRLLSPRLVGRDVTGREGEIYVLSDMEENLRLNIALKAEVERTGYGIWGNEATPGVYLY